MSTHTGFDPIAELDALSQLTELAIGYRANLEKAGFSPTIAESLAAQYLSLLVNHLMQAAHR